MKKFLDENFLLQTKTAEYLYHEHAVKMPIIDYHNHLIPRQIAENTKFENITQAWLHGDHYKWRAMRTNGVAEKYCTGDASDWEKFKKWAETIPYTFRNPVFHWTQLELKRYFDIHDLLTPESAKSIYDKANIMLNSEDFRVRGLLNKMNVEVVCTTDDPSDTLEYHQQYAKENQNMRLIPAWRPDKSMAVEDSASFNEYINRLGASAGKEISSYRSLLEVLKMRHDYFHENGCRLSDHGLEEFYVGVYTPREIENIFSKLKKNKSLSAEEINKFKSAALYDLAVMDYEKGWTQQFHFGAMRNNNTRMYKKLGPDIGFDSIGDFKIATSMSRFFDRLNSEGKLAKTILYNLNPADNEIVATMIGNFQDGSVPGKLQWGSGWWFLDQKKGMEDQLNTLSVLGLLSRFVGMLTDSRSFLSYPRHEYFRRILCNLIATDVENGELPDDKKILGNMVEDICYNNAKNYFNF
ncbi:MAG: glucuronate isomerase [Bacteroidales bacterium]|nr:glucuronate isomerase [Bacteroidales bacterium]